MQQGAQRMFRVLEFVYTAAAMRRMLLLCLGWLAALPLAAWEGRTMGTFYVVKLAGAPLEAAQTARLRAAVEKRFDELNRQMSHYLPESELSRFNTSTSTAPVKVSSGFASVMRQSLELHRATGGAFDPTLGPLLDLWGFGPGGGTRQPPTPEQVTACRAWCGATHLRVTAQNELQKDLPGLRLNLGAIAKGYAADEAARVLRENGCANFLISVGGEVVASGVNEAGRPWQVGIERPDYGTAPGAALSASVPLSSRALSTSGDSRQFFRAADGTVYAHILDPATGKPVRHNLASVTVIATNGLTADALATALFVLGPDRGLRWVEAHPDLAALFILRETDGRFRLLPSARFPVFQALEK
jgi:thiamine biosynthesis lipoprotein